MHVSGRCHCTLSFVQNEYIQRYKNGKYFRSQPNKNTTKLKLIITKTQYVKAVDDVSFSIKKDKTFGLVGESLW